MDGVVEEDGRPVLGSLTWRAGNLAKDPTVRAFPDGTEVAWLRLACDGEDGVEWVTAEVRRRNLTWLKKQGLGKGDFVICAGREHERYNDFRGEDERVLRVVLMACHTSWERSTKDGEGASVAAPSPGIQDQPFAPPSPADDGGAMDWSAVDDF